MGRFYFLKLPKYLQWNPKNISFFHTKYFSNEKFHYSFLPFELYIQNTEIFKA